MRVRTKCTLAGAKESKEACDRLFFFFFYYDSDNYEGNLVMTRASPCTAHMCIHSVRDLYI